MTDRAQRRTVKLDWDQYRRKDGTIDLRRAARGTGCLFSDGAFSYLECIEEIMPINSRQAAAVAIVAAMVIKDPA